MAVSWFSTLVRVAGAGFAFTAPLVQLQSELDSKAIQKRLLRLEDPISSLHQDVREISEQVYDLLRQRNSIKLDGSQQFYERYARVLALLESRGLIRGTHGISQRYVGGLWISSPHYILYMAGLYEAPKKMDLLVKYVDEASDRWLKGEEIAAELSLPTPVVKAVFEVYESQGLGMCSKQIGAAMYRPIA